MTEPLLIDRKGACVVLTLNRPESLNALSGALRRAFIAALDSLAGDDSVRVVVITGAGRAFCAGLDVKELAASGVDVSGNVDAENIVAAIERFPKPVIAAVNGLAVTGGVELMLACDMTLASEDAAFADTHVKIGLTPGWGLSQRLSRLIGLQRAKEMSLSARRVDAQEALAWGLVNRVTPRAELLTQALALAAEIAQWPPQATQAMKAMIDAGAALALGEALRMEAAAASARNAAVRIGK